MSSLLIYGTGRSIVEVRLPDGSPQWRITFQSVSREGLELSFTPLGKAFDLGSGAGFQRAWSPRRFRAVLSLNWTHAIESTLQAWTSGAWGSGITIDTAEALRLIHNAAWLYPVLVQPHASDAWTFEAWIDKSAFTLSDIKGVCHTNQRLSLISRSALELPAWTGAPGVAYGLGLFLGQYLGGQA